MGFSHYIHKSYVLTFGGNNQSLHRVFKLPDVSLPRQLLKVIHGAFVYLSAGSEFFGILCQKVVYQHRNVLRPVAKPRNSYRNHVKAVIEVSSETPLLYKFFKVSVSGGYYSNICLYRSGASNSVKFAVLNYTQELCLHFQRQLADFIEEHYAVVGNFKIALFTRSVCSREGSLFVAEKLRFYQVWRNGATVNLYEGLHLAVAVLLDEVCHLFLSDACFSEYDHIAVVTGNLEYFVQNHLHGLAVKDKILSSGFLHQRAVVGVYILLRLVFFHLYKGCVFKVFGYFLYNLHVEAVIAFYISFCAAHIQILGYGFGYVKSYVKVVYKVGEQYRPARSGSQNIDRFSSRDFRAVYGKVKDRFSVKPVDALRRLQYIHVLYIVKNPAYEPVYATACHLYSRLLIQKTCDISGCSQLSPEYVTEYEVCYHVVSNDEAFLLAFGKLVEAEKRS